MTEIKKQSYTIPVSLDAMLVGAWGEQWPRRVKETIEHPITPSQQIKYDAYVRRFNNAVAEYEKVIAEGERKGWAYGGMVEEGPSTYELHPRTEYIFDETYEEYRERVLSIIRHHKETGEWLEEPQPTIFERAFGQMFTAPNPDKH